MYVEMANKELRLHIIIIIIIMILEVISKLGCDRRGIMNEVKIEHVIWDSKVTPNLFELTTYLYTRFKMLSRPRAADKPSKGGEV